MFFGIFLLMNLKTSFFVGDHPSSIDLLFKNNGIVKDVANIKIPRTSFCVDIINVWSLNKWRLDQKVGSHLKIINYCSESPLTLSCLTCTIKQLKFIERFNVKLISVKRKKYAMERKYTDRDNIPVYIYHVYPTKKMETPHWVKCVQN